MPKFLINLRYEKEILEHVFYQHIGVGNTFYKTITLFGGATVAGMLVGTTAPVVVTSRADTADSKFYSLATACLKAINKQ